MTIAGIAPERREVLAERIRRCARRSRRTPTYDELRLCHNGLIDRRPALIACCRGTADVVAAVRFALAEGLELAVRGGGHNVSGRAVSDGGLVVDLSLMRAVDVDRGRADRARPGRRALVRRQPRDRRCTAWRSPAARCRPPASAASRSAVASGGSWACRAWRPTTCSRRRWCSRPARSCAPRRDEHPDLFWALRGGGGNFGVVTSFVFRLHPQAEIVGGLVAHPIDAARDMLAFYADFTAGASDELTVFGGLVHAPDGSGMPLAAMVVCHAGPRERRRAPSSRRC